MLRPSQYPAVPGLSLLRLESEIKKLAIDLKEAHDTELPIVNVMASLSETIASIDKDNLDAAKADQIKQYLRELFSVTLQSIEIYAEQDQKGKGLRLINGITEAIPQIIESLKQKQVHFALLDVIGPDESAKRFYEDPNTTLRSFYSQIIKKSSNGANGSGTMRPGLPPAPKPAPAPRPTVLGLGDPEALATPEALEAAARITFAPLSLPSFDTNGLVSPIDDEQTNPLPESPIAALADEEEPEPVSAPRPDLEDTVVEEEKTNVFINPAAVLAASLHGKANGHKDRPSPVPASKALSARTLDEAVAEAIKEGRDPKSITGNMPGQPVAAPTPAPQLPPSLKVYPLPATIAQPDKFPSGTNPDALPRATAGSPVPAPLEPLPLPAGIKLPSHYLTRTTDRSEILVREKSSQEAQESPRKSPITKLRALVAAATLAVVGIGALGVSRYSTTNTSEAKTVSSQSASSSPKVEKAPTPVETKVEQKTTFEAGLYRMDTNYSGYQNYLQRYKMSSGLIQIVQDFSEQTRVEYRQNPAEVKKLRDEGALVMTGQETEAEQKMIMFEAFLRTAAKKNLDNYPTVKGYFNHHRAALARFQKSGKWDAEAIGYGSKEFSEIFGKPLKFKNDPNVAGYTFDNNPESNRALGKIKSAAPTYYKILLEAGDQSKKETDPAKISKFDDPMAIKTKVCQTVAAIGRANKNPDVRSGIAYMNGQWCKPNDASPDNYLNQALQKTIPIMSASATIPTQVNQPVQTPQGTILPNIIQQPTQLSTPVEAPKAQPSTFQKAWGKLKSIFSSEQKPATPAVQPAKPVTPVAPQPRPKPVAKLLFKNDDITTSREELMAKVGSRFKTTDYYDLSV